MQRSFTPASSNVAKVTYDDYDLTLLVEFKDGATWEYGAVPEETFQAFQAAPSAGKFFHTHVKGRHSARRV